MGTGFVTVKTEGPLAFVQLNRPPANAYNLDCSRQTPRPPAPTGGQSGRIDQATPPLRGT